MACRLCLKEKPLSDSHIIPEFFYSRLYDGLHRFVALSTIEQEDNRIMQKGVKEQLLCADCENFLSPYEDYVRRIFYGGTQIEIEKQPARIIIQPVSYPEFRIFQMSVLWRASVSSLPFFCDVNLGVDEDRLRRMVLAEDPGEPHDYGTLLVLPLSEGHKVIDELIVSPDSLEFDIYKVQRFVMGGCSWIMFAPPTSQKFKYQQYFLHNDSKLYIHLMDFQVLPMFKELIDKLKTTGKICKGLDYFKNFENQD